MLNKFQEALSEHAENNFGHKKVQGSDHVAKIMTPKVIKHLKTIFDHREQVLMRQASQKFGCTHSHTIKTLAKYTDIKTYMKHGIPDQQESQK